MRLIALTACGLLLLSCGPVDRVSDVQSDSGVIGDSYEALTDKFANLAQVRSDVQLIEYGKSVDGLPLRMIRIGEPAADGARRPAVLITEATHGNEYLDIGYEIAAAMTGDKTNAGYKQFFAAGGIALFVPVVNPDGYEYHRTLTPGKRQADGNFDAGNSWGRANKNRKDLNRDYKVDGANHAGFTQPETKALAAEVAKQVDGRYDLKVTMDLHCCVGSGALLVPIGYSGQKKLPASELTRHRKIGSFMQEHMPQIRVGSVPGILGYTAVGGSNDYFYEQYKSLSFVYEGRTNERARVESHKKSWSVILRDAAVGYEPIISAAEPNPRFAPDIKLFLFDQSGDGDVVGIAIGTSNATSARLCRGNLADCLAGRGPIEKTYDAPTSRAGAVVFAPSANDAGIALKALEEFTVLLDTGSDLRGATFRLEIK